MTYQIRRLLGFETRMQVDAFLKSAGVYFDYIQIEHTFVLRELYGRKHPVPRQIVK